MASAMKPSNHEFLIIKFDSTGIDLKSSREIYAAPKRTLEKDLLEKTDLNALSSTVRKVKDLVW